LVRYRGRAAGGHGAKDRRSGRQERYGNVSRRRVEVGDAGWLDGVPAQPWLRGAPWGVYPSPRLRRRPARAPRGWPGGGSRPKLTKNTCGRLGRYVRCVAATFAPGAGGGATSAASLTVGAFVRAAAPSGCLAPMGSAALLCPQAHHIVGCAALLRMLLATVVAHLQPPLISTHPTNSPPTLEPMLLVRGWLWLTGCDDCGIVQVPQRGRKACVEAKAEAYV